MVYAHLEYAVTYRPDVPHVAERNVAQTRVDPCHCGTLPQAADPALECRAFDHIDHA